MSTPLTVGRPTTTEAEALALAREWWGVDPERIQPLPSDRDRNFLLETPEGERLVLKVFNVREERAVAELQDRTMEHVGQRAPELELPRVVPTPDGQRLVRLEADRPGGAAQDGAPPSLARVTTWVPGRPLAEASPRTEDLLEGVGGFLGSLTKALTDFTHPAAQRDFPWDLQAGLGEVERRLPSLPAGARVSTMARHLEAIGPRLEPLLPRLRTSVIHGDANDHNLLVRKGRASGHGGSPPLAPRVTGIIDFGDMLRSWTVGEPAVAAAYALLGTEDPVGAAARVLGGFHAVHPLEEVEIEAAHGLIILRLLLSLSIGAEQTAREPDNEYLGVSREPAWTALELLTDHCPNIAHATYRHACGLDPSPGASRVGTWLRSRETKAGPVIPAELRDRAAHPLDLGTSSLELDSSALDGAAGTEPARLADRVAEDGDRIPASRWNEARAPGGKPSGDEPRVDGREPRTVHMGIELFLEPGTPVHAPLAGRLRAVTPREDSDAGSRPVLALEHRVEAEAHPSAGPLLFHTLYRNVHPADPEALRGSKGIAVDKGAEIGRVERAGEPGRVPVCFQVAAGGIPPEDVPAAVPPDRREVWKSLCPDPSPLLGVPGLEPLREDPGDHGVDTLLERRHRLLGRGLSVSYRKPLHIVRGWKQRLYDAEGRSYLDCVNNVPHVGHAHPRVVEALARQAGVLNTNTRYLHRRILDYAERLAATLPDPLSVCFLVNSGSEANELALRLAEAYTGARDVVVLGEGYHGNTSSLVDISPYKFDGPGGAGPPPWVHRVPTPDPYRGRYRTGRVTAAGDSPAEPEAAAERGTVASASEMGRCYAAHVAEAARKARERGGLRALFAEPILSCAGQVVPPPGFLSAAYASTRREGGLCVSDEVQVGMGRVGRAFWGFELAGVVPDIVTMGKPLGNGHPLGAVVTTPEVAEAFDTGMEYFNTFGGNPVSCAVGLAVLDVLEDEGLQDRARTVGERFRSGLRELMEDHPVVGDVRGEGLFLGVELVRDRASRRPATAEAAYVVERMRERRILLSTDGPDDNVLKIKPPLPFSTRDAERVVETLDEVLGEDAVRR